MARQELLLQQRQTLTSQQIQSLALLIMPQLELEQYLNQSLMGNPVLELDEEQLAPIDTVVERVSWSEPADFYSGSHNENSLDDPQPIDHNPAFAVSDDSPRSVLLLEASLLGLDKELQQAVRAVIECLDENGYLPVSNEEIGRAFHISPSAAGQAVEIVQNMEPRGLAAHDLRECLLLQLCANNANELLARRIVGSHLEDLAAGRIKQIARSVSASIAETERAIARIRMLDPHPVANMDSEKHVQYVVPDLIITMEDGGLNIKAAREYGRSLRLDNTYLEMRSSHPEPEIQDYLREQVKNARQLIRSIKRRQDTIDKLAAIVFSRQSRFFVQGPAGLVPLTMKEVAQEANIHESTVCRAISGKYIQTPFGVYPWKFFFPRGVENNNNSTPTTTYIKALICRYINQEDKRRPLGDNEIMEQLRAHGIDLARRTVAKYRTEAGIPARSYRRQRGKTARLE